ncbi:hypothetical protein BHE74_00052510 [Ensete ventricosum]|nr:hypothetical protein BHE74_00052510 [Ensete ventricosum]
MVMHRATKETPFSDSHAEWVLRANQMEGTTTLQLSSASVVIKLNYNVMLFLDGRFVEEPPCPYRTFLFTLDEFLHQDSRSRRQLVPFCNDPIETTFTSGNKIEMFMDVLLTHFSSDEEPSLDIEGVDEDGDFGGIPTSINAVKELVVVKYERGGDIREESCIICFEEFNEDVEVTRMPSKHVFHGNCLTRWLESSHVCPQDRIYLRFELNESDLASDSETRI